MKKLKITLPVFFFSVLTFLFMSFGIQDNRIYFLPSQDSILIYTILFAGIIWVYGALSSEIFSRTNTFFLILNVLISAFFSIATVMGVFYSSTSEITASLEKNPLNIIKAGLVFLGGCFLFFSVIQLTGYIRTVSCKNMFSSGLKKVYLFFFEKKCFLKTMLLLIITWSAQIIIRYPGIISVDSSNSLKQYWGIHKATTQHPILYTVVLGKFMDFGLGRNNAGLGLFLFIIIQTLLLMLVLSYTVCTLKKLRVPAPLLALSLIFFVFAPVFSAYATTAIIDTLYCIFFLLLANELVYYLFMREKYMKNWYHYLLTAISVFGLHFRHNGLIIGLAVFVLAVLMELYLFFKKQQRTFLSLIFLAVILLPAFGGKTVSGILYDQYNAQHISTRVVLSLPLQQVSRCMYIHGNELSDEDLSAIRKILKWDVEEYQKKYNPLSFDGIKKGFNSNASAKDLTDFLKTWLKLLFKYPGTCISATMNQNYFLFSPRVSNDKYYSIEYNQREIEGYDLSTINTPYPAAAKYDDDLLNTYYAFSGIPVLGLFINQGICHLILLAICLYALFERNGKLLFFSAPLLLTLLIAFVGPMAYQHPRYTYPILYTMPLLAGLFLTDKNYKNMR